RLGQTVDQLAPIKRLMGTIALDHAEIGALDFFVGGIPISAFQTFESASNAKAFPGLARIDHLILPRPALWTTHSVGALSITQQLEASTREIDNWMKNRHFQWPLSSVQIRYDR